MNPRVAQFLAAQGLGQAADAITTLVVAATVLGGSSDGVDPAHLLDTLGAATLPYLFAGPLSGVVADHWDRRRMLFVVNLARAGVTLLAVVAVVGTGQPWGRAAGLMAVAGLLSCARFVYNLRAASLPHVGLERIGGARRTADPLALRVHGPSPTAYRRGSLANAGRGATERLVALDAAALRVGVVAVALGGGLAALTGGRAPATLLVLAAALQATSSIGFLTLQCDLGGRARLQARVPGISNLEIARRVGRLLVSSPTRVVIAVTSTHRALLGAAFATFVLVASNDYGLGPKGYVMASAVTGFGGMLGTLTATRGHALLGTRLLGLAAFAAPAAVLGLTPLLPAQAYVVVAVALVFFVFQNLRIVADAQVQAAILDTSRARVFSVYDALYNLSYFAGAAAAVTLSGPTARAGLLGWIGLAYLALTFAALATAAARQWTGRVRADQPVLDTPLPTNVARSLP